ncbi:MULTISPECIES: CHAT domain-containing protein [Calothrix]|uniref:Tetratricopeptide repeat protein n=2 Tax=Calothrix TaxID=1186 RepID=A0ABR8A8R6_9CYAN|nr:MULTISPECIES: CHAT domain-containing protein [Calothrix]MBD2195157.1 tetratricopeptide repeat protein [Calothrix parietina FACHB-288]MBD2223872.1 tetratricopeptide repeat protein [Calothrix anomala FACHB-343]
MPRQLRSNLSYRTIVVFVSMILASESVGMTAKAINLEIAQKPTNTTQNLTPAQESAKNQATQLIQAADKLLEQRTATSLQQAVAKYLEALKIWREIGDRSQVAATLASIGNAYYLQSETQKALEYYNQALAIRRELKDKYREAMMLQAIADVYMNLRDNKTALEYYNQALPIFRTEKQPFFEAVTLIGIGRVYFNTGETKKALEYYNQALEVQRASNNLAAQVYTLEIIARVYTQYGEPQKALEVYNQVLAIQRQQKSLLGESETLNAIGTVYFSLGENQKAKEYFTQAWEIQRKLPEVSLGNQAITVMYLGMSSWGVGEHQKGLEYLNQARSLMQKLGNRFAEAEILGQISILQSELGQKQSALDALNQALKLQQENKDPARIAATINSIADIHTSSGEYQTALDFYNQALTIQRQIGDRLGEGQTLSYIAKLYNLLGDSQLSIDTAKQALEKFRTVGDRTKVAQTLDDIGNVYRTLEDYPQALDYYNQALQLWREQGALFAEFTTLTGVIRTYESLKEYTKALETANQALSLSRKQQNRLHEASALAYLGRVYLAAGDEQKALDMLNQAVLRFQQLKIPSAEANVWGNIARVYKSLNQPQQAIASYDRQLKLQRNLGDRTGEAETLYNIAVSDRDRQNLEAARTQIESTIKIIEDIRTRVTSQELRTSYFASVQKYYEFYIDLLMQLHKQQPSQGYNALALQASERARARSLLDLLTEAHADIRQGVDPQLLATERNLQQQLDALEKRRLKLLGEESSKAQVQQLEQETATILEQYRQIQAKIRATSPRYAALTQPQTLSLTQIQSSVLDDNTLLLEYALGEERSYLWAVTKNSITSYELPKRAEIAAAVQRFRQVLTSPISRSKPGASANLLTKMILAPVAQQLGQRRLVIVADGALQYIPFAALNTPSQQNTNSYEPLVINHEIVTLPSASTVAVLRQETNGRKTAPKTLAVIADPIFSPNDERVKKGGNNSQNSNLNIDLQQLSRSARAANISFERLPFTRQEAETILSLVPAKERKQAFDFAANRAAATNIDLSQYRIIHLATHGILNSQNPELSGVVLSLFDETGKPQNGFLRLHDIFNLKLPAELVVLSACETGLGEEVKGEGLIGLTRGFMYAGSPRVVVSLWSVDDEATSELMKKFYGFMLQNNMNPAAALRAAQREMWRDRKYQSPYFWAAFTLQGEWK